MQPSATIIADSLSPYGERLTTFQVCMHRFVLAEANTHRIFSRNSASSRAIPLHKQIEKVLTDPAIPVVWASEQKGMSGGAEIQDPEGAKARWEEAAKDAAGWAKSLGNINVHKSIANRLLEPFLMHTVVITATGFNNFFHLRLAAAAQPEIRLVAEAMKTAFDASTPTTLREGFWHLPYIDREDIDAAEKWLYESPGGVSKQRVTSLLVQMSTARCARVSYETQGGKRDIPEDIRLYTQLSGNGHYSPMEHVATPDPTNRTVATLAFQNLEGEEVYVERAIPLFGNFIGWRQHRLEVEIAHEWEPLT
jgi:thymidylate synthase ThyX